MIAPRGSICLDGVSLTVNDVLERVFWVTLIPETRRRTTLGSLGIGSEVNLEVDLMARYVAQKLATDASSAALANPGQASPGHGNPSQDTQGEDAFLSTLKRAGFG